MKVWWKFSQCYVIQSRSYFWLSTGSLVVFQFCFGLCCFVWGFVWVFVCGGFFVVFWKRCSPSARYCFLPLGKDRMKIRKTVTFCLSSLQLILEKLLLSDHQSCSFVKDSAEGHARQKKILNSSNNEQLKVTGKLKVVFSSPYVWLCKELHLVSEQWKTSLSLCDDLRNEVTS